jgi:taurine dioxygenase
MSFYRDFNDKAAVEAWTTQDHRPFETIRVTRLSPTIGAEIDGVDLSRDLSDRQFEEIKRAIAENLVLVFRNQAIEAEDQKRLAGRFGTLHRHLLAGSRALSSNGADPEILAWHTDKESRYTAGDAWHADVTCDKEPIWGSFLRLLKVPDVGGGDTAFANMYLAYAALSDPLKALLDGLTAIHDGSRAWTAGYGSKPEPGKEFPVAEHPVVARHPLTGRKFLFVNEAFISHIVQLTRPESDAILSLLFRQVERNLAFQTRLHWTADSLVFWDNWATQHHAVWDYFPDERRGERVSVFIGQGPQA